MDAEYTRSKFVVWNVKYASSRNTKKPIQNNISLILSKINKGNVKKKESSWLILNNYHNTSKMA